MIATGVHSNCPCLRYSIYSVPIFTNSRITSTTSSTGNTTLSTMDLIWDFASFHVDWIAPDTSPSAYAVIAIMLATAIELITVAMTLFLIFVSLFIHITLHFHQPACQHSSGIFEFIGTG